MIGTLIPPGRGRHAAGARLAGLLFLAAACLGTAARAEPIRGAGSTFAAPIIDQWSRAYEAARTDGGDYTSPDWKVDYEPVGSLAGIMRLGQPDMDFAATDAPLPPEEVARRGWVQFPVVMGGIVAVANIDAARDGALRLSGAVLADIYLGKVRTWSDPAVKALNPDIALPDAAIQVLHRQDGSGSTFTFARYLSRSSPEWREKLGADTLIAWPVGSSAKGTGGLAALTAATRNSIAYLEYGQAVRAGLPLVSLQNQAGAFVRPEPASFRTGLAAIDWSGERHFHTDAANLPGAGAYPVAAVTYVVLPKNLGPQRSNRVLDLFGLAFRHGAAEATARGYIPISPDLAGKIEAYWAKSFGRTGN